MIDLQNEQKYPYICTPLIGSDLDEILSELANIVPKKPDLIEWRVDFFKDIDKVDRVLAALEEIHNVSNGIPLLFTIRSHKEGGQEIPLFEDQKVELLSEVCKSRYVDMIDFEVHNHPEHIHYLRKVSKSNGKQLILSYHNFSETPDQSSILHYLFKADFYGADVAKVAVMPNSKEDVQTLLYVTSEAKKALSIPLITISMGDVGSYSRMVGWFYGSALTFASGEHSSAPGQVSIETMKMVTRAMKQSMGMQFPSVKGKNIALIGFMGVGKTTIGELLAERLGWEFVDIDDEIERRYNMKITEIFQQLGEATFREIEREICLEYCQNKYEKVLSLGGGAYMQAPIKEACLTDCTVIALDLSWGSWLERFDLIKDTRPVLHNKSLEEIQQLFYERQKAYSENTFTVKTDGLTIEEVVDVIEHKLTN